MKFVIPRDVLLEPLNLVAGVVERRQTLPILANVHLSLKKQELSLTGTDLEVELCGRIQLEKKPAATGEITLPARKLMDICKALPAGGDIELSVDDQRALLKSGRSKFTLSTLPASDFPTVEKGKDEREFRVDQATLKRLIESTAFAMAQQDVRYYLNGMLWEFRDGELRLVATDGHRLAMATVAAEAIKVGDPMQVILPRKGVLELARLLDKDAGEVSIVVGGNHLRLETEDYSFTSKLVEGKFPEYERVIPRAASRVVMADRDELKQAFSRAAILSNEKYRGIRLDLSAGNLQIVANNPEQEEAEENVAVEYAGDELEIGFNVSYLLDVMGVLTEDKVKFCLGDANSSALLEEGSGGDAIYVVMPMRL